MAITCTLTHQNSSTIIETGNVSYMLIVYVPSSHSKYGKWDLYPQLVPTNPTGKSSNWLIDIDCVRYNPWISPALNSPHSRYQ